MAKQYPPGDYLHTLELFSAWCERRGKSVRVELTKFMQQHLLRDGVGGHRRCLIARADDPGNPWRSQLAAAAALGVHQSTIRKSIREKRPCKGVMLIDLTLPD